jgi:hypothetical protein
MRPARPEPWDEWAKASIPTGLLNQRRRYPTVGRALAPLRLQQRPAQMKWNIGFSPFLILLRRENK